MFDSKRHFSNVHSDLLTFLTYAQKTFCLLRKKGGLYEYLVRIEVNISPSSRSKLRINQKYDRKNIKSGCRRKHVQGKNKERDGTKQTSHIICIHIYIYQRVIDPFPPYDASKYPVPSKNFLLAFLSSLKTPLLHSQTPSSRVIWPPLKFSSWAMRSLHISKPWIASVGRELPLQPLKVKKNNPVKPAWEKHYPPLEKDQNENSISQWTLK